MINGTGRSPRLLLLVASLASCAVIVGGCAAETSPQEPEPSSSTGASPGTVSSGTVRTESGGLGTGLVGGLTGALGICTPLTCCFPTGAEWGDNPFENGLRSLGCSMPAAYTQKAGSTSWYLYSQCPASAKLDALVSTYAKVSPYDAEFVSNLCLTLNAVGELKLNSVFVEFDPTCASCKPARG
jgi:hypothetical protein